MVSIIKVGEQHEKYVNSPPDIVAAVDAAFNAVIRVFKSFDLPTRTSDEAEELVAAIHHYLERST